MRHVCVLAVTALLMTACGGSAGTSAAVAPPLPVLLTPAVQDGMLASNDDAEDAAISGNGLFVAFQDESGNVVPGDGNERDDIGLFDLLAGTAIHASTALGGAPANDDADDPALDQDGSHCAFESDASNLVPGDTNDVQDVFVRNVLTGVITRVSVASDGTQATGGHSGDPALSADGSIVVFESHATNLVANDTNDRSDIFVHDMSTGVTTRISVASNGDQATDHSYNPAISADGNLIVFESNATDLVGSDGNTERDVFLHDRSTGDTTRLSVGQAGGDSDGASYDPRISDDGTVVAFYSSATDLVTGDMNGSDDVFVRVLASDTTSRVSVDSLGNEGAGDSDRPDISADGNYVVFRSEVETLVTGDTNMERDVFRHDRSSGETIRVNVRADGSQASRGSDADHPAISDDGMRVVWDQGNCEFVPDDLRVPGNTNVLMKDLSNGALTLLSLAGDRSRADGDTDSSHGISRNGRWVVFASWGTNLVPGDTNNLMDIFRRDTLTGVTTRILETPPTTTNQYNWGYDDLAITDDGRYVCFVSGNPDLLGAGVDLNGARDVFLLDTMTSTLELISRHTDDTPGDDDSFDARMTPDARYVVFASWSMTLVTGDAVGDREIFLRDRQSGETSRAALDKDGMPIDDGAWNPDISDDGRYVVFRPLRATSWTWTRTAGSTSSATTA